jgi:hypothetical protein
MERNSHVVWRKALDAKGRDWVSTALRQRPGQPDDVILDVVFEEPYPTREFCQQWCAEQDNRMFHLSRHTIAIIIASILLVVFGVKAVVSWEDMPSHQQQMTR